MEAGGRRGCCLATTRDSIWFGACLEQRGIDCFFASEEVAGPGTESPTTLFVERIAWTAGWVRGVRFRRAKRNQRRIRRPGPAGRRGALPGIGGAEGPARYGGRRIAFAGGPGSVVEGIGTTASYPGAGIGLKLPEVAAVVAARRPAVGDPQPDQPRARPGPTVKIGPEAQFRESFEAGGEGESIVGVGDAASDASL